MMAPRERLNGEFGVIVSHPHKQAAVYEWPMALQREGIPVTFLTGLYYNPQKFPYSLVHLLPTSKRESILRKLLIRNMPDLDPDSVISVSGPWLEIVFRPLGQYHPWYACHDWLASKWIDGLPSTDSPTILHCFDGSSTRTIKSAKTKGITTVLEITLPLSADQLVIEERRRLGLRPFSFASWVRASTRQVIKQMQTADYVVAQSKFTVDFLQQNGIAAKRIILQPLGVDTERFRPSLDADLARPFRLIYSGQICVRKGIQFLLDAWTQLNLQNAELVLTGSITDNYGGRLLAQYKGRCCYLGFVPASKLPLVYQSGDVFILPSLAEGGSNVVFEALASGLPCIVSTNAISAVRDGIEGFVVPIRDVASLKDRIQRLYFDPALRARMSVAARARAEQFTWRHFGRRLTMMYRHILNGSQQSADNILDMTNR